MAVQPGIYKPVQAAPQTKVYGVGLKLYGQLGVGDKKSRTVPTLISILNGAIAVSASDAHTLVLMENGDVYSFGDGSYGALGHGDEEEQLTPKKIEEISNAVAISVNGNYAAEQNRKLHSFVLTDDGSVYSFGRSRNGVLGHGTSLKTPKKIEKFLDGETELTGDDLPKVVDAAAKPWSSFRKPWPSRNCRVSVKDKLLVMCSVPSPMRMKFPAGRWRALRTA
jgi:hypothetical protein